MQRALLALIGLVALLVAGGSRPARAQDLECDAGDREVRSLNFVGNRAFTDDQLALRIVTTASTWSRRHLRIIGTRRCLDSDELFRDKYRLQLLYHQAGYYNTKVDTLVTPISADAVNVSFLIDEGQPVKITSLTIAGLDSVRNKDEILSGLWVAVGKPYDQTRLEQDVQTILSRLRNAGYPRPDVLRNYETSTKDSLTAHIALTFLPGPLAHIGAVQVSVTPNTTGHQEISDRIVRKLVGTGPGDLFREQTIADAQRNLYQTGAYRFVQVLPLIDSTTFAADSTVNLKVTLIEDYMRDLNTEFGWATLDCFRVRAQLVDKNFLGGAQRLELTGQLSKIGWGILENDFTRHNLCYFTDLSQDPIFSATGNYSINATLRQPALFGTWATPSFSLYSERRSEYKAFLRQTYVGGEASLLRALSSTASLRLGYNIELGKTIADPALLCAAFARCDSASIAQITTRLPFAVLSGVVAQARTNNPINPSDGYALRLESRNSATFLGSDPQLTFIKGVGDAAWYHPVGFGNILAFRLRLGGIWGGADVPGGRQPPQQERLYAGGPTSVRGFEQNELGSLLYVFDSVIVKGLPRAPGPDSTVYFVWDSTRSVRPRRIVPVGGNTLFVMNVDYRIRSILLPELLQFTLFTDVGSVWNRNTQANSKFKAYWTPGVGLRLFTPIGPIQVNAGYNPYPSVFGQALFTAGIGSAKAAQGFTNVYCAVSPFTPVADAPKAFLQNGVWQPQQGVTCNSTYQPMSRPGFWHRLTFTFSLGPDF